MSRSQIKEAVIEAMYIDQGFTSCEHCYRTGHNFYHLHHIIYRSEAPKHEYLNDRRNAILLCPPCHDYFHKHKEHRASLIRDRKLYFLFPDILYDRYLS